MSQDVHSGAGQLDSGKGLEMARRRYQRGRVRLRGKLEGGVWWGEYRESVLVDGKEVRRWAAPVRLGTKKEIGSKKLALRELEPYLNEINSLAYRPRQISTFAEFCDRWEKAVMVNHKRSAQASEKSINKVWLRPKWGSLQLKQLEADPEACQAWASSLDVEPKTQRNIVKHLRRMLDLAIEWGYMKYNPLARVRLKPLSKLDEEFALSLEQMRSIISAAQEPYKTMYWILGETGIRAGEVLALGWEHVDLETRVIHIRRKLWRGEFETVKSRKGVRDFAISQQLAEHLKSFTTKTGLLFSTEDGEPITYDHAMYEEFQPLLKSLGIPICGFHAFRHGNATLMDRVGAPMKVRMERLGHEETRTTNGYTHMVSEDDRRVAAQLGNMLTEQVQ